ncbi:hypothetical protein ACFLYO_07420, partial [Chloroflexota bacterium]
KPMPPEFFTIFVFVVIGFIAFVVGKFIMQQVRLRRSATSALSLSKQINVDGEIESDAATLVAWSSSSKDEFLGLIDVLDGHHTGSAATERYTRDVTVIKAWQFLGSGDRYNARKRSADFKRLVQMFWSETQSVIAAYRQQGWRVETISTGVNGDVYHLSR